MDNIGEFTGSLDGRSGHVKPGEKEARVIVYGPLGQLKEIKVGPGKKGSTAGIVYWDENYNRPRLNPILSEERGSDGHPMWGLYEDLCRSTGLMGHYEKAKRFYDKQAHAKANGRKRILTKDVVPGPKTPADPDGKKGAYRPVPAGWYHPVLEARRANHDGGRPVQSFEEILGVETIGGVVHVKTSGGSQDGEDLFGETD